MSLVDRAWAMLSATPARPLLHFKDRSTSAAELLAETEELAQRMTAQGLERGHVLAIELVQGPASYAAILAGLKAGAIVAPLLDEQRADMDRLLEIACVDRVLDLRAGTLRARVVSQRHPLLDELRSTGRAGLIVFTSGSTGVPKAIVHDSERVLKKFFDQPRPGYRTIQFLPLNHMGGINTFLGSLVSQAGVVVIPETRTPSGVGRAIQDGRAELLPATPGFILLLAAHGIHRACDLSSISLVTYGADVVPDGFLERAARAFPNARFLQTYGLSELGVLHTRSRDSGSLWVKVGGTGYEVRIVEGMLQIRTEYAMLGYLNAPSPFDADGWMHTGDAVLADGEYLRILGRNSDMITVGGAKVFPVEVESVLLQAPNVADALCYGVTDRFLGAHVAAKVVLHEPEDPVRLRERLRLFCLSRLEKYKVPIRFEVATWDRFEGVKKKRTMEEDAR